MSTRLEHLPHIPTHGKRPTHVKNRRFTLVCALLVGLAGCDEVYQSWPPEATAAEARYTIDHEVPSTPEKVVWGWFPIDKEPVLRVAPATPHAVGFLALSCTFARSLVLWKHRTR